MGEDGGVLAAVERGTASSLGTRVANTTPGSRNGRGGSLVPWSARVGTPRFSSRYDDVAATRTSLLASEASRRAVERDHLQHLEHLPLSAMVRASSSGAVMARRALSTGFSRVLRRSAADTVGLRASTSAGSAAAPCRRAAGRTWRPARGPAAPRVTEGEVDRRGAGARHGHDAAAVEAEGVEYRRARVGLLLGAADDGGGGAEVVAAGYGDVAVAALAEQLRPARMRLWS